MENPFQQLYSSYDYYNYKDGSYSSSYYSGGDGATISIVILVFELTCFCGCAAAFIGGLVWLLKKMDRENRARRAIIQ